MKYIKTKVDFINEKKSYQLNEGQFSWMTQDTNDQIGSEKLNTIDVYMYDNEGNKWKETRYDGYGIFGGMDYYDLVATMNGYDADRQKGIDLAFGKLKTKDKKRKTLFPALVTDPRYNWKRHDFTEEAEGDPNQSWYQEEYEEDFDESVVAEGMSWNDVAKVMDAGLKKAKVPLSYARDYVKSLERMAKRNSKKFFSDYGDFTEDDFIEDVEYNMANENKSVNENDAKIIVKAFMNMYKRKSEVVTTDDWEQFMYDWGVMGGGDYELEDEVSYDTMDDVLNMLNRKGYLKLDDEGIIGLYEAKDFEPHMMYDPETGDEYKAEEPEDHERMSKLGYVHKKPKNVNEARAAAKTLLNSVVKGDAKDVEGIKMSKEMADAYLEWLRMSAYGKKFGALPFDKLFSASFNWGIERYIGKDKKIKDELKILKAKAKEMKESLTESKGDKAVSMAQKKLDKVMTDLKANLLKFKDASSDKEKETFKSEAGRLTKLRKDAHDNLEQAIQDAYADVELMVIENYDSDQRKDMAAKGLALPDGSFPIKTLEDLKNAIQAYGRSKDQAAAAKFIAKRAKALGAEDLIPDTEDFQKALKEASFGKIPKFGK